MRALYIILLGNPELKNALDAAAKTRFKQWWRLIGSAIENVAAEPIDFQQLFLEQDDDDEDAAHLGDVLEILYREWINKNNLEKTLEFDAGSVSAILNSTNLADTRSQILREVLCKDLQGNVSPKTLGYRLKKRRDAPVFSCGRQLVLRMRADRSANTNTFWVEAKSLDGKTLEARAKVAREQKSPGDEKKLETRRAEVIDKSDGRRTARGSDGRPLLRRKANPAGK